MVNIETKQNNSLLSKKIIAIIFWTLSITSFLLLVKTELRKWFVFEGEPSSANGVMFWIALGFGILFAYLGKKTWTSYKNSTRSNNSKPEAKI